jgi:hypothetical protein
MSLIAIERFNQDQVRIGEVKWLTHPRSGGIVKRYSTVVTVYALLSATPAFAAGGGAIA